LQTPATEHTTAHAEQQRSRRSRSHGAETGPDVWAADRRGRVAKYHGSAGRGAKGRCRRGRCRRGRCEEVRGLCRAAGLLREEEEGEEGEEEEFRRTREFSRL